MMQSAVTAVTTWEFAGAPNARDVHHWDAGECKRPHSGDSCRAREVPRPAFRRHDE